MIKLPKGTEASGTNDQEIVKEMKIEIWWQLQRVQETWTMKQKYVVLVNKIGFRICYNVLTSSSLMDIESERYIPVACLM